MAAKAERRRVWSALGLLRAHANPTGFIKSHLGFRNRNPTGSRDKQSPERPARNSRDKQTNKRLVSWPARINRQQPYQGARRSYLRHFCTQNRPCPRFKSGDSAHTASLPQKKLTQKAASGDQFLKAATETVLLVDLARPLSTDVRKDIFTRKCTFPLPAIGIQH